MKLIALVIAASFIAAPALAKDAYVKPHITKNGNFVQGHYRSTPDGNRLNNYSTQGNTNPYTGKQGTVDPFQQPMPAPRQPSYGNPAPNTWNQPRQNPYGR